MGYGSIRDSIESVAAPVIGFALGGPAGAAIGSGLNTAAHGGSIGQDLMSAGLGYVGGNVAEMGGLTPGAVSSGNLGGFDTSMLADRVSQNPWGLLGSPGGAGGGGAANVFGGALNPSYGAPTVGPTGAPIAQAANPMGWGSPMNLMQMGSGLYGIAQGRQMKALAQQQIDAANAQRAGVPLPTSQNITQMPGYQAGLDAVQRSMLAQGYQGSGNMMAALQNYGTNAYQTAMQNYQNQQQLANSTAGGGANIYGSGASMSNAGLGAITGASLFASPVGNQALMAAMGKTNQTPVMG